MTGFDTTRVGVPVESDVIETVPPVSLISFHSVSFSVQQWM